MTEKLQFLMKLNEFATQLYRICASGKADENVAIAPFFLQNLLTATLVGSRGRTSEELICALMYGGGQNLSGVAANFRELNSNYRETESIAVANKMLIREPAQMDEQFPSDARRNFDVSIQSFSNREKNFTTVESVNKWVAEKTRQNVTECVRRGLDFDATSDSIVLLNAAHFGAMWEHKFTKQEHCCFWIDDNHSQNVDFMRLRTKLRFAMCPEICARILELDFADDDFAMVFLLPDQRAGLARLIEQLPSINLMYAVAQLRRQDVEVRMPRFKIDHGSRMREALIQLGVRDLFSEETADVSGIVNDESFCVSEIIHRASVAITEDGEESSPPQSNSSAPHQEFIADHPFLFFIKHKCNVVFIGHVANPTA